VQARDYKDETTSFDSATKVPKGGPGMREMLGSTTAALYGQGLSDKDSRLSPTGTFFRARRAGCASVMSDPKPPMAGRSVLLKDGEHHQRRCREGTIGGRTLGSGARPHAARGGNPKAPTFGSGAAVALCC